VPSPTAEQLRARAVTLRRNATSLDAADLLTLHWSAGHDVWIGPTAARFIDDLASAALYVKSAAQACRDAARSLEQQAAALAAQAALQPTGPR
jgi:hypothetical protein